VKQVCLGHHPASVQLVRVHYREKFPGHPGRQIAARVVRVVLCVLPQFPAEGLMEGRVRCGRAEFVLKDAEKGQANVLDFGRNGQARLLLALGARPGAVVGRVPKHTAAEIELGAEQVHNVTHTMGSGPRRGDGGSCGRAAILNSVEDKDGRERRHRHFDSGPRCD
jgi:hypothetical protein